MEEQNPIFKFLSENKLTSLDEKSFVDKYSSPEKAKEIHSFMVKNDLTKLDEAQFYDKYLKKKEPTTTEVPNLLKPLSQSSEQSNAGFRTSPSEAMKASTPSGSIKGTTVQSVKAQKPKDSIGDYNPDSRIKLYNQAKTNIQNRIPDLVQQYNNAETAGDQNAMAQLKGMIDTESKKIDYFDKAIEGQVKTKFKAENPEQEEVGTFGDDLFNGLKMAGGGLMSGVNFADEFISSLNPFKLNEKAINEIRAFNEENDIKRPSDIIAKAGKEILKSTNESVEADMKSRPYSGGVYDALKNGDFSAAKSNAAHSFLVSLPTSLLMSNPYTGYLISAGSAQESVDEARERKGTVTSGDYAIGALKASTEYAFENLFGNTKALKELISKVGKEAATDVLEQTVKGGLKEYFKDVGINISEETLGEALTQITTNAIDMADGKTVNGKKVGLFDNVPDAGLIGLFGGATQGTLTTTASHYIDRVNLKKAEAEKAKAADLAEKAAQAPNQVAADAIHREAEKLNDSANEIIENNNKIGANAPAEVVSQIEDNNKKIDELESTIAQSPPDVAEVLTAQLKELQSKNDELTKNAEKAAKSKELQVTPNIEALKDVESTTKELDGKKLNNIKIDTKSVIPTDTPNEISNFPLLKGTDVVRYIPESVAKKAWEVWDREYQTNQTLQRTKERGGFSINEMDMFYPEWRTELPEYKQAVSEAYHKAKSDGSNPELVKAVEDLLGTKEQAKSKTNEPTPAQEVSAEPQAVKSYADSVSSRDLEQGFGEDTVEGIIDGQYYKDIIASAKAEGIPASKVLKDMAKSRALDNLESREDLDNIENQIKADLATEATPAVTPTKPAEVEPIDEFVEANYTQIMADLKLKNRVQTSGCAY
jgi:hypothetical protein